ncbi:hypothetical protein IWZ01DRAFT_163510 [Phyllosticta capitalensis]
MAMRKMLQIALLLFQFPSLVPSMPSCLNHSITKPCRRFSSTHCLSASMALQFMRAFRGSIVENASAICGTSQNNFVEPLCNVIASRAACGARAPFRRSGSTPQP